MKCIYSSPLDRALNTALEIANQVNLPVVIVPDLCTCATDIACSQGGLFVVNWLSRMVTPIHVMMIGRSWHEKRLKKDMGNVSGCTDHMGFCEK